MDVLVEVIVTQYIRIESVVKAVIFRLSTLSNAESDGSGYTY